MSEPTSDQSIPLSVVLPPTQEELPYDDGIPMESERHVLQMQLLIETLRLQWADRQDFYIGGNMFVYFSLKQVRKDFRGPDVFVVLGVPKRERKSWVVWEEGKGLDVVIELLSESTAQQDKTEKKQIYQNQLRVPEYFWFDPFNPEDLAGFALCKGIYEPLAPDTQGRFFSQQLGLTLIRWQGTYRDVTATWLRWATLDGDLLPTSQEQATQAEQRAERLAAQLRAMGIQPESDRYSP